ncbi:hypothetical protein ACVRZR_06410 [Streptococcus entericus]|uniref:hypothetical protein n=1 Tax=Streptococcus entericus TaxID=155680 RepID=UPI000378A30B|nr:hypothetical protein [Streptococcus entericus]
MLGDYSIMDWANLIVAFVQIGTAMGVLVSLYRDNKAIERKLDSLSKEHEGLSNEQNRLSSGLSKEQNRLSTSLSAEHNRLSKEHEAIKQDTTYISDEMKLEKMARQNLYHSTSRAKEILETMDIMKEVVLQNAKLSDEVKALEIENQTLRVDQVEEQKQLLGLLRSIDSRLSAFEQYSETEEIRLLLRKISNDLSEQVR